MGYWKPSGRGIGLPGVPATNYSDAAMSALEEQHPGIKTGGAFVRVDDAMPEDEPKTTPSEVEALSEEQNDG
jgi:hypothetical protein